MAGNLETDDAALETEGSVYFRFAGPGPRWPSLCVVCGETCAETVELYSVVEVNPGTRFARDVRGTRSFQVPAHVTVKDCRRKLLHPVPFWAYIPPVLFALAVGAFMGYIAKPDWNSRGGAFTIFGAMALFVAWIPLKVAFRPALEIRELGDRNYIADFSDEDYARKFAGMNADVVMPIQRPSWDIDLFPRRRKR